MLSCNLRQKYQDYFVPLVWFQSKESGDEMDGVIFFESQRFDRKWIWAFFSIFIGFICIPFGLSWYLVLSMTKDSSIIVPFSVVTVFVGIALSIGLFVVGFFRIDTEVNRDSITVKCSPSPLNRMGVKYPFQDVETMYHRSCRPIKEFGGYGVRWGFGNNGRAFLVSGAKGIQLLLKGGGKVFIGSKKANHFIESVSEMYPEKLRPDVSLSDT